MNAISLSRMKYLFVEYFVNNWKRDLSIFCGVFLVRAIFTFFHLPFTYQLLVAVISVILCGTFNFLYKGSKGMSYLLNPVNTEEKVIVNLLLVHVYFTAIILIPCFLGGFSDGLFLSQFPIPVLTFSFFEGLFVIQSIFLFFAIYFKKNAILKTVLLFAGFLFVIVIVILILLTNSEMMQQIVSTLDSESIKNEILEKYSLLAHFVNWITIVFFWVVSYFRLKETEV